MVVVLSNRHAGWASFPARREDSHTEIDSSQQVTWWGDEPELFIKTYLSFQDSFFLFFLPHFYIRLSVSPSLSPSLILLIPPSQRAHMFPLFIPGQSSLLAQNTSMASPNIEPDANVNRSVFLMPCVWGPRRANLIGVKRSGSFCLDLNTHTLTDASHQRSFHVFQTSPDSETLCYCFLIQSLDAVITSWQKNKQKTKTKTGIDRLGVMFVEQTSVTAYAAIYRRNPPTPVILKKERLDCV